MIARRISVLRRSAPLLLALVLVGVMSLPAEAATVGPNVDISAMSGNEAENAIAVNPTNPLNIVAMSTLPDVPSGLFEGVSFDGGLTWSRSVIGTGGDLGEVCCDEQLTFDPYGNLWMTYLLNTSGDVLVALSTDGGLTLAKVADIVPTKPTGSKSPNNAKPKRLRGPTKGVLGDQPSIAAGPASVWVSWTSFPSTVVEASGAPVTGLGLHGAFSAPEPVPTANGRGDFGDTAVGPNGQVMVTYQDQTNGSGGAHMYTAVDPDGLGPAVFGNPVFLARTRVGGFDYVPVQPDRSVDAEPNLAWDRSGGPHTGRVYAVWTQELKNESDNMDIMLQHSDDSGTTWSAAVRVNDDPGTNSQVDPAIAIDQSNGDLALSWLDARNDLGAGGSGDTDGVPNDDIEVWATYSTDGGATLAPNFQVSEGASNAVAAQSFFDYGDYTHASFASGSFYPAWSDNSNSTGDNPDGTLHQLDLYTAKVTIP
jgi:hypothetical protein